MFRQVFDPDNLLWRIVSRGVDFVGLGLLWTFMCLPVITAGPATAALYYTVVKTFRQKEDGAFTMLIKQFTRNLKKGIPLTCLCVPVILLIFYGYSVMMANSGSSLGAVMFVVYYIILVIPVGTILYLFPVMGRFDLDMISIVRNSVWFAIRHLPSTLILVLLNVEAVIAVIGNYSWIFVLPVGITLLDSVFMEQIFIKYLTGAEKAAFLGKTLEEMEEEEEAREAKKRRKRSSTVK